MEAVPGRDYWTIETAPENQGLNGGMIKRQAPEHVPTNYVSVESVDQFSRSVEDLGGREVMPKQEVPGMGYFAICLDPEGHFFDIWEDKDRQLLRSAGNYSGQPATTQVSRQLLRPAGNYSGQPATTQASR